MEVCTLRCWYAVSPALANKINYLSMNAHMDASYECIAIEMLLANG